MVVVHVIATEFCKFHCISFSKNLFIMEASTSDVVIKEDPEAQELEELKER